MHIVLRRSTLAILGMLLLFPATARAQTATPAFTEAQLTAFFETLKPDSFATLPAAVNGKASVKVGEGLVVAFPAEGGLPFNAVLYADDLYLQCDQMTDLDGITNVIIACQALKAGSTDITITELQANSEPKSQPWKKITVEIAANTAASPTPAVEKPFSDVSTSHRHFAAIAQLKSTGIIGGYPDGTFRPDITINRAEFTKIIMGVVGEITESRNCFTDVREEWFAPSVCAAKENGIIGGYPDGSFGPDKSINFAEAVKIVVLAFSGENQANFTATGGVAWYAPYLDYANENSMLRLIDHLIPRPSIAMTRGQVAQLIANILP